MIKRERKHGPGTPAFRLKEARQRAGHGSAEKAAEAFEWAKSTYAHHESGVRNYASRAAAYAEAFNVSVDWLLYGDEPPPPALRRAAVRAAPPVSMSSRELTGGADAFWVSGYGDEPIDVPFPSRLLEQLGVTAGECQVTAVGPDNATPELPAGSTVLFDTADRDTARPGTFAVASGAGIAFRQLQDMIGTEPEHVHVAVHGANPHQYNVPKAGLNVLGRVRWVGTIL